ncbi:MAG: ComEC/Rec2 family competence protein [Patescibacteria group bacterium]
MTKSKIFLFLVSSFLLGIFGASVYYPREFSSSGVLTLSVFSLIIVLVFWKNRPAKVVGFCLLFFALGIWRFNSEIRNLGQYGEAGRFEGEVLISKEPENKNGRKQIVAEVSKDYKVLIFAGAYDDYHYGDRLNLSCDLEILENKEGSRFDYRMYLAKDKVYHICRKPKIEILGGGGGKFFYSWMLKIKNGLSLKIGEKIPFPESGLLEGLLLGGDAGLSDKIKEDFSRTGMSHITAVSGYNVTIIAEYLMLLGILLGLWRRQAFWLAVLGIFLFIFLIGFPPSAVRAGIMGGLILLAMKKGRLADSENAILFSAALMLLWNPLLLRYDIGFQLSFLATLGIIQLYPIMNDYLIRKQKHLGPIGEILGLTLAAQIFVLPIILFNFKSLSIISPLANLLVLPIIPLTMLLGFFMLVFSFIFSPLAILFSWLAFLPLRYEIAVIEFLSGFGLASVSWKFPSFGVVIWYLALGTLFFIMKRKRSKNRHGA